MEIEFQFWGSDPARRAKIKPASLHTANNKLFVVCETEGSEISLVAMWVNIYMHTQCRNKQTYCIGQERLFAQAWNIMKTIDPKCMFQQPEEWWNKSVTSASPCEWKSFGKLGRRHWWMQLRRLAISASLIPPKNASHHRQHWMKRCLHHSIISAIPRKHACNSSYIDAVIGNTILKLANLRIWCTYNNWDNSHKVPSIKMSRGSHDEYRAKDIVGTTNTAWYQLPLASP